MRIVQQINKTQNTVLNLYSPKYMYRSSMRLICRKINYEFIRNIFCSPFSMYTYWISATVDASVLPSPIYFIITSCYCLFSYLCCSYILFIPNCVFVVVSILGFLLFHFVKIFYYLVLFWLWTHHYSAFLKVWTVVSLKKYTRMLYQSCTNNPRSIIVLMRM